MLCSLLISACAGYHVSYRDNPLLSYDIRSIAVPMFVNRSVIPHVAAPMTQEIVNVLNQYEGLKVVAGESYETDSILLGIVDSAEKINETITAKSTEFAENKTALGNRQPFYYPSELSYNLQLQIILIKRPSPAELELFKSDIAQYLKLHPKAIINEVIPLSGSYQRVANDNVSGSGGDVNYVKNVGIFEKSVQDLSRSAAITFRDLILNAF
jgi:hypothetical protein